MGRRYREILTDFDVLGHLIQQGQAEIGSIIPADAHIVSVRIEESKKSIWGFVIHTVMESNSFEEIAEGSEIPEHTERWKDAP